MFWWLRGRGGQGFVAGGPGRPMRGAAAIVWLVFIIFPLVDAITSPGSVGERVLAITGAAAFVAVYLWLVMIMFRQDMGSLPRWLCGVLIAIAALLTIANRSEWGFLFTYAAACAAVVAPSSLGFPAVFLCSGLAAGAAAIGGASGGSVVGYWASTIGVGLLMVLLSDLRERNLELTEARAELAQSAVAQERERFARDLHDLLGHTLSVIAIKAELAGRLLPERPDEAAAEVADVEQVARKALGEVREAVSGYRKPTLDGELEGARMALTAAGIEAAFERSPVRLDPEVEAVLAWAVREGATNVIRHSSAHRCQVTVSADAAGAVVEVVDDGQGAAGPGDDGGDDGAAVRAGARPGNGIAGLAERAERLRGRIEAGRRPDGVGFRLAVSVPG
ncbi:MAG: sensor histidine kinase, partial [Solirubrobacteraceae bacterium]